MDRGDYTLKPEPRSSPDTVTATQGHFPSQVTMWSAGQGPRRREAPAWYPVWVRCPLPRPWVPLLRQAHRSLFHCLH